MLFFIVQPLLRLVTKCRLQWTPRHTALEYQTSRRVCHSRTLPLDRKVQDATMMIVWCSDSLSSFILINSFLSRLVHDGRSGGVTLSDSLRIGHCKMILVFKTCIFFPQLALFLETSWVLLFGKTSKFELGKTARLWNSHLQPLLNALLIFVLFLLLYSFNRSFRRNFCNFSHFVTFETLQSRLVFPSNLLVFENLSSLVIFLMMILFLKVKVGKTMETNRPTSGRNLNTQIVIHQVECAK